MVTSFGNTINTFPQDINPTSLDIFYVGQYANGKYTDGYVTKQDLKKSLIVTVTSTYTVLPDNDVVLCDGTTSAFTVTLPTAVGIAGVRKTIKKIDSQAHTITVDTTGGQTIDGASTQSLSSQWQKITVMSDGTNWQIV